MCVFSLHSVIKDPPFSRLDVVSCRNLLIYLNGDLQERVVRTFHYALRSGGVLFLGPSEGVSRSAQLFEPVDAKHRLFRRTETATPTRLADFRSDGEARLRAPERPARPAAPSEDRIERSARKVLEKHSPAYLVVNRQNEIVRFSGGQTGRYLEPSAGVATLALFGILRKTLRPTVRAAVDKAFHTRRAVVHDNLRIRIDGQDCAVRVIVEPVIDDGTDMGLCVVAFEDLGAIAERGRAKGGGGAGDAAVQALEDELARTREQAAVGSGRGRGGPTRKRDPAPRNTSRSMRSCSRPTRSWKPPRRRCSRSTKSFRPSTASLSSKNDLLTRLNNDMQNLLESTQIATIFLDNDMRIKGFTPAITTVFHLREPDRGRPITEIVNRLAYDDLQKDVRRVLKDLSVVEREVQIPEAGTTFIMHIRPYHTADGVVDGVVITFVDITERRRTEESLREHAAIVEFAQDALMGVSLDGKVRSWNPGAERLFGYPAQQAIGLPVSFLVAPDQAEAQAALITQALNGVVAGPLEMMHRRQDGTSVDVELTVMPIRGADGAIVALAATARDVSERRHAETHRTLLLHELSHRVKNTLAGVQSLAMETLRSAASMEAFRTAFVARLVALSNTHNLLTQGEWQGAALNDVLEAELAPYQSDQRTRWKAVGPDIQLTPKMALAMGLAFHELATNAVKYGALSTASGRIDVSWQDQAAEVGRRLHLSWIESGGPAVQKPTHKGFGSRLIAEGLAFELDGEVQVDYHPAGLRFTLDAPLDPIKEAA